MKIIGILIIAFAVCLFYVLFFKFAPYIGSLLPSTDWTPFLKFLVYVVVAWLGGILIPVVLLFLGFGIFARSL